MSDMQRWMMIEAKAASAIKASGASRVNVRISWLRDQVRKHRPEADVWRFTAGQFVAKVGCPDLCIEVWTVEDDAIASDWEAVL